MNIKTLLLTSLVFMGGCVDMQATRLPENKLTLHINKSYQAAYRRILQSTINECNYLPDMIKNASFEDNNSANITSTYYGTVAWTMDFIKETESTSTIYFYTNFSAQKKFAYSAQNALNNDTAGCVYEAPPTN